MALIERLRNVFSRHDVNHEIDDEIQFHIEERIRENVASGMSAAEARRDALRRFGSRAEAREQTRNADVMVRLETVLQDLVFAIRGMRHHPTFALVSILTLALGIGANTAIFSVVYSVLFRPLPFEESDRLFVASYQAKSSPFWLYPSLSDHDYLALRESDGIFESTASVAGGHVTLTGAGEPVRLSSAEVTPDFFRVLRVNPTAGRTFAAGDEKSGEPVVVLGESAWRSRFGADASLVGRTVMLDGVAHTVVGILGESFAYPGNTQVWRPLAIRNDPHLTFSRPVIGRLRADVTPQQAQAAWESFTRSLPHDGNAGEWSARLIPLKHAVAGDVRRPLLIFMGAVGFVLLIACANVSNVLLMRSASRRHEIATRLALGAGRPRIVRQLLTESAVLGCLGGLTGIGAVTLSMPALLALVPAGQLPRDAAVQTDGWVLALAFVVSIASGIVLGVVPALHITRKAASRARREGMWATGGSDRVRQGMVVVEVALALVLLVGAGLMVRSFLRLNAVNPGFEPEHVMTMTVDLPEARYRSAAQLHAFDARLLESLRALPDVAAVGAVNWMPLGSLVMRGDVRAQGRPEVPDWLVMKAAISSGYMRSMGIRLLRGRDITDRDTAGNTGVILVSDSVARQLWPGEEAVGQRLSLTDRPTAADWLTVVGVVDDIRHGGKKEQITPAVYQPYAQVDGRFFLSRMTFVVRTAGDPVRVAPAMQTVLRAADPEVAPQAIASLEAIMAGTLARPRFQSQLLTAFSMLALTLAVIGVYGVLASSVAERQREIGIRIALGAAKFALVRMVLGRAVLAATIGIIIGYAAALALTGVLRGLLFEIEPTDAPTFAAAGGLLLCMALIAGLRPALRAGIVDPLTSLRAE
jgi:predicted permease